MKSLAIDDEFVALTKLTAVLTPFGQCDAATNGFQALDMYCKALGGLHPYDLVTIDIEMREMDGLAVLQRLREEDEKQGGRPSKKVIVSAASRPDIVKQAVANKCDAFLVKPIRRDTLIAKVKEFGLVTAEEVAKAK